MSSPAHFTMSTQQSVPHGHFQRDEHSVMDHIEDIENVEDIMDDIRNHINEQPPLPLFSSVHQPSNTNDFDSHLFASGPPEPVPTVEVIREGASVLGLLGQLVGMQDSSASGMQARACSDEESAQQEVRDLSSSTIVAPQPAAPRIQAQLRPARISQPSSATRNSWTNYFWEITLRAREGRSSNVTDHESRQEQIDAGERAASPLAGAQSGRHLILRTTLREGSNTTNVEAHHNAAEAAGLVRQQQSENSNERARLDLAPLLSTYHTRGASPTPPSRPLHTSHHSHSSVHHSPSQPDPALHITQEILESYALSRTLNPDNLPWHNIQFVGRAINRLRTEQTSLEEQRARYLAMMEEERERVNPILRNLALCGVFSDSRTFLEEMEREEERARSRLLSRSARRRERRRRARENRPWVHSSQILTPGQYQMLEGEMTNRETIGIDMGVLHELENAFGPSVGAWFFGIWVAGIGDGADDSEGWIDAFGRQVEGGPGTVRWVYRDGRGRFEIWG